MTTKLSSSRCSLGWRKKTEKCKKDKERKKGEIESKRSHEYDVVIGALVVHCELLVVRVVPVVVCDDVVVMVTKRMPPGFLPVPPR